MVNVIQSMAGIGGADTTQYGLSNKTLSKVGDQARGDTRINNEILNIYDDINLKFMNSELLNQSL